MTPRHTPRTSALSITLGLSTLIHLLTAILLSVQIVPPPAPMMMSASPQKKLALLSPEDLQRIRRKKRTLRPRTKREEEPPPPEMERKQIVEIPPPKVERVPVNSELLSRYNSATREEVVNRERAIPQAEMIKSKRRSLSTGRDRLGERLGDRRALKRARRPKPPSPSASQIQPKRKKTRAKQADKATRARANKKRRRPPKPSKPLVEGEGPFKRPRETQDAARSQSSERAVKRPSKRGSQHNISQDRSPASKVFKGLTPTHVQSMLPTLGAQDLTRKDGSIDHIPRVKRGDRTQLNTREYRYAFFFNRVKQAVAHHWKPQYKMRSEDPTGRRFGVQDRRTVLSITLRADGSIARVRVNTQSGVKSLDRVAVEAFMKAQPFHNPPPGLLDADGMIRFDFGFFLEINGRGLRLFR